MKRDFAAAQRLRYFSEIVHLFPQGDKRLDLLCAATAQMLECQFASINLITEQRLFSIGVYNFPVREVVLDRPRPFDPYQKHEIKFLDEEIRKGMHLDLQGVELGYIARVPFKVHGVIVGGMLVADARARVEGLNAAQWQGLEAAAELGSQILRRSETIKTQLAGLVELIVP